jgi:anaerobic magnesium-protoporphyrin IX monomethyl ester cyclase
MKPDAMEREDVLKGVLQSYARFYARKSFLDYPFIKDPEKRRYMLGCLKAFAKTTLSKRFYDLGRVQRKGFQIEVDLQFDQSKILSKEEIAQLKAQRPDLSADVVQSGNLADISACGAPRDLEYKEEETNGSSMADISACGAPRDLEYNEDDEQQPAGMSMKI